MILDIRRSGRSSVTRRRLSYWVPEAMARANRDKKREPLIALCKRCGEQKAHKRRADAPDRPHSSCLDCQKIEMKAWHAANWAEEKLRNTLKGMINRCHRPDTMKRWANAAGVPGSWRDYGAAGVKVCTGLRAGKAGLALFLEVVGLPPTKAHTLDRIDPERGYECGRCEACTEAGATTNVRWATKEVQDANRKNARPLPGFDPDTGDYVELTINEWARRLEIPAVTIRKRLKGQWSLERALRRRGPDERDDGELPDLTDEEVRELEADEPEPSFESDDSDVPF